MKQEDLIGMRMKNLGYKAWKIDESGNCAFVKDFKSGSITVSYYEDGVELYSIPTRYDDLVNIIIHDKEQNVVLEVRMNCLHFIHFAEKTEDVQ
jgi:hypothetical protein